MDTFSKFTLDVIRQQGQMLSWMEEKRFEWIPLVVSRVQCLLNNLTFVIMVDEDRAWLEKYIISTLNKTSTRPLLPIVSLYNLFPRLNLIKTKIEIELMHDMLNITFPNGFIFFYIGKANNKLCQIAKSKDDSFLWVLDEKLPNSFYLKSSDELLDVKLVQLVNLFSKSIDAFLYNQITLDEFSN